MRYGVRVVFGYPLLLKQSKRYVFRTLHFCRKKDIFLPFCCLRIFRKMQVVSLPLHGIQYLSVSLLLLEQSKFACFVPTPVSFLRMLRTRRDTKCPFFYAQEKIPAKEYVSFRDTYPFFISTAEKIRDTKCKEYLHFAKG